MDIMNIVWIALGVVVVLAIILMYNRLVKLRNIMRKSHSVISVYLQQRFDLIPNLMNVVKGYVKHEKEVLAQIASLRTQATTDMKAAKALDKKMFELFAVAEAHPDLKASEQFLNLQQELSKMENQLQAARRSYNMSVNDMNTAIESIPTSIIATIFGFKKGELFESTNSARENVKVEF